MDFIRRRWLKSKISHNHNHDTGTQSYKLHNHSKRYPGDLEFVIDNSNPGLFSQTTSIATASNSSSKFELAGSKSMVSIDQVIPFNESEQDNAEQNDIAVLPTSARKVLLRRRFTQFPISGEVWKLNEMGTVLNVDLAEGKSCNSGSLKGIRWFEFDNIYNKGMKVRLFYNDVRNSGSQDAKIEYYVHSSDSYDEDYLQCIKQDLVDYAKDFRRSLSYLAKLTELETIQSNRTETTVGVTRDEKEQEHYKNNYQELKNYAMKHTELAAKTVETCYDSAVNSLNSSIQNVSRILCNSAKIQDTGSVELMTPDDETSELEPLINQPLVYTPHEDDSKLVKLFNLFRSGNQVAPFNNYFLSTFPIRLPQDRPQEAIDETQQIDPLDLPMDTPRTEISAVEPVELQSVQVSKVGSTRISSTQTSKTCNYKPDPNSVADPKRFLARHILNINNPNGQVFSGVPVKKKYTIRLNLENSQFK